MTRLFPALLAVSICTTSATAQDIGARLNAYMDARTALGQFSGSALVARNDTVLLSNGFGYASLELQVPNTTDTRFRAASLTKQIVAMAILQLRDAGRLSLSDPLCKYVDSCPPQWAPVKIEHLLRNSSGIPDYEEPLDLGSEKYVAFMVSTSNDKRILDEARTKPLDFPPATKYKYSNTGYMLLSLVIEKASGTPFARYLESKIFRPAGMVDTGVLPRDGFVPRTASGYTPSGSIPLDSTVGGIPLLAGMSKQVPWLDYSGLHGDGSIYTTPTDLMRWLRALDGTTLAKRSTVAEMFVPGLGDGVAVADGYAYGWIVGTRFDKKLHYHTGFVPGFASRIERFPETGVTVIVMSNIDNARISRIARDLAAAAHGLPYDVPRSHKIIAKVNAKLQPLVGTYRLASGSIATVSIGDTFLEMAIPNRFTAGLLQENDTTFYVPFFEGTVTFNRAGERVTSLTMHYDGVDQVAQKQ